ncbi:MAG: hypothetical protein JST93_11970 [Acidobacteria bacterium]|nr:hypothetical protein [Acidobacteriota bacterium]
MNYPLLVIALVAWLNCTAAQPDQAEKRIKAANETVDTFVGTLNPEGVQPQSVERTLKNILSRALYPGQSPAVYVTEHPKNGRFLMAVYTLDRGFMGQGGTAVILRVYQASGGRFILANVAGNNMDGYGNVTVKQLHSPTRGEAWLLLWGYMTGANGPNMRMRVFACDGRAFRSVWMPENVWGSFRVNVTATGFAVEGEYYRERNVRRDAYSVAEDGIYRAR